MLMLSSIWGSNSILLLPYMVSNGLKPLGVYTNMQVYHGICVQDQPQLQKIAACAPQLLFEPKVQRS